MSDNIVGFEKKKKVYYRFTVTINYMDDTTEDIECTFFGTSVDNPDFMLFSNAHPDAEDEKSQIPDLLINTRNVKSIRTKNVEELER